MATNLFLWNGFEAGWPSNGPANIGGAFQTIPAFSKPLVNTILLLSSGVTITLAHHALTAGKRIPTVLWMWATVAFGVAFLYFQAPDYTQAYTELNFTLDSGIYSLTFFIFTVLILII